MEVSPPALAAVFRQQFSKTRQFQAKLLVFEIFQQNTTASTETLTEK